MLRVGSVPYLVGRPLDLGLDDEPGIELVREVPARLVRGLRDGSIDVALVSSIELFRQPGYGYLDGIAVAGHGYVASVQVFLRRPLPDVRSVALDPASQTARVLAQVVWPGSRDESPSFLEVAEGTDPRSVEADGWLRIGDAALREHAEDPQRAHLNPSAEWRRLTGLPFVFAPWIVRPGIDVAPFTDAFVEAFRRGVERTRELADQGARESGLAPAFLRTYLEEECLFDPRSVLRPSLLEYRDRAAQLGLARGDLSPHAIPIGLA